MGGGVLPQPSAFRHSDLLSIYPLYFQTLPNSFALFCTYQKLNSFLFMQFRTLCAKHPGGGRVNLMPIHRSHQFGRSLGRNHLSDSVSVNSVFSAASVLIPIPCSTFNFQLSTFDRRSRPCRDCQGFCALRLSPRFRTQYNCFFTNQRRNLPLPTPKRKIHVTEF